MLEDQNSSSPLGGTGRLSDIPLANDAARDTRNVCRAQSASYSIQSYSYSPSAVDIVLFCQAILELARAFALAVGELVLNATAR